MRRGIEVWNKVILTWGCCMGLNTAVHVNGHFDRKLNNPKAHSSKTENNLHGLFGMEAISLPRAYRQDERRRGQMVLEIKPNGPNRPPNREAIVDLLTKELQKLAEGPGALCAYEPQVQGPKEESWTETLFTITFDIAQGEDFTDVAIEIGRAVLAALGVRDEHGLHLTSFGLDRPTYAKFEGNWITFENWLRIVHRLPVLSDEDAQIFTPRWRRVRR